MAEIEINGPRAWDIQVHDERFYNAVLHKKVLGFGESYMAAWWDCEALDQCVARLIQADVESKIKERPLLQLKMLMHALFNFQTKGRAVEVAKHHYDLDNDLFSLMLDSSMIYSCGYWKSAANLKEAQLAKLDLICKKLGLMSGMKLLDIGCGWGGLAKYAATHYGVEVLGITISEQQKQLAEERCRGLPVEIRLQDYRDLSGSFDRVVSIGMFEHVGYKNYHDYMQVVNSCLVDDGLFLLHTIGNNYSSMNVSEWLEKYIFPNGMLPSIQQLGATWEKMFIMEDWHNFGPDYDPTLMSWYDNFNQHWDELKIKYDETFRRMWNFYLLSCAGAARARYFQLWQIVLSKGKAGVYRSVR